MIYNVYYITWVVNKLIQPSDLPQILRYDLFTYKLLFSKEKNLFSLPFKFCYFPIFLYRARSSKGDPNGLLSPLKTDNPPPQSSPKIEILISVPI